MSDYISRQAAIDALDVGAEVLRRVLDEADVVGAERAKYEWGLGLIESYIADVNDLPSAQSEPHYDEWCDDCKEYDKERHCCPRWNRVIRQTLKDAQPEQRYTEEELRVFRHGISLSLLSKRSSQHWQYDEDTATEIKFLERLYEKVSADMRGCGKENRWMI